MTASRPASRPRPAVLALALSAALDRVVRDPASVGAALAAGGSSHPVGRVLAGPVRLLARTGLPGAAVLAAHGRGDAARVEEVVRRASAAAPSARRSAARAVLSTGDHEAALRLLGQDRSRSATRLRARALWTAGRYEEAVAVAGPTRLARRWQEEVELLRRRPSPPSAARRPAPPEAGEPLRVLHLVTNSLPHTRSGYTARTHDILRAQRDAGMQVAAVTPYAYPTSLLRLPSGTPEVVDGIPYHRLLPARWDPSPRRRHDRELELLGELVERFRPHVLHAHSHFVNALTALEVGHRHGLPVVYEVRGMLEETWAQRNGLRARTTDRYRVFQQQEAWCVGAVDAAVTIGQAMRTALTTRATPLRPLELVPNAVPAASLDRPGDREATRVRLGIPAASLVVGSVSSVVDYEGFEILVDAVRLLAEEGVPVTMLLVGDGDAAPAVRARARDVPPPGQVLMPGRVAKAEVADHLAALDVFVVPRRDLDVCRVVTPLKPAEAMAAGLPLVVSDLPALREFVDDGVEGFVVAPEDPEALAAALRRLADPSLRHDMGRAGRSRVEATRTWEAVVVTYDRVYRQVIAG